MLEAYRQHVADRAAQNIPPAPLSPEQVADLLELLKTPQRARKRLSCRTAD
jgi:aconitate hydratase 2/2-methylisocitrate dehydratase